MTATRHAVFRAHHTTFAVIGAFVCILIGGIEFAGGLARANKAWHDGERELAGMLAEEAAFALCAPAGAATEPCTIERAWLRAKAVIKGGTIEVAVTGGSGRNYTYCAPLLAGGGPEVLRDLRVVATPPLAAGAGTTPATSRECAWLVRDDSVGLMRIATGTDLEDWRFRTDVERVVRPRLETGSVVRVSGHLWIDRDARPLVVEVEHSLTILIEGNLYLGCNLQVRGPGNLTLVACACPGLRFSDRDGDGRRSASEPAIPGWSSLQAPIEGSGTIYIGLPDHQDCHRRIECDALLWAEGEVLIDEAHAVAHAPVAAGIGFVVVGIEPRFETLASRPFVPAREDLPGFVTVGEPRPGRLRRR